MIGVAARGAEATSAARAIAAAAVRLFISVLTLERALAAAGLGRSPKCVTDKG
jgi:hypothetical protein